MLEEGVLEVDMERKFVKKIWALLITFDEPYQEQVSRYDSYTINRSTSDDVEEWICEKYESLGNNFLDEEFFFYRDHVEKMDIIEYWCSRLSQNEKSGFQCALNEICMEYSFPWIMANGYFFKIDYDYIDINIVQPTVEMMMLEGWDGAQDEFANSLDNLGTGDFKSAIHDSAKSFESVLKVILGVSEGNASTLLQMLAEQGFFDTIPSDAAKGITQSVFMALPFLRNRLAGHGQGSEVVEVPENYARLAVEMAAIFNRFFIQESRLNITEKTAEFDFPDIPF